MFNVLPLKVDLNTKKTHFMDSKDFEFGRSVHAQSVNWEQIGTTTAVER